MAQAPILISGAGLSSLLLAQRLHRAAIPFRIFERDASLSFRGQGYRLRLSNEGLDAIEDALGPELWPRFWEACGKTGGAGWTRLDARTGEGLPPAGQEGPGPKGEDSGKGEADGKASGKEGKAEVNAPAEGEVQGKGQAENVEKGKEEVQQSSGNDKKGGFNERLNSRDGKVVGIARGEMRKLFLTGCEEFVEWNKHVTGYELTDRGVKAVFADGGKSVEGSLLVGGEGIKSQVAKQLSEGRLKVFDLGARGIHGQAPSAAFKGLGEGVFSLVDDSGPQRVSVITNVRPGDMDDPSVQFGWTMIGQPGAIKAPNDDYTIVGKVAADIAKELTKDWSTRFRSIFEEMNVAEAAFWKITCSDPNGVPEWNNQPRVTLIGDAVHSMTPAGGLGANTAVRDSSLLGRLLAEAGGWKEDITAKYEKEMRVYGSEAVAQSYGMAKQNFKVYVDANSQTV